MKYIFTVLLIFLFSCTTTYETNKIDISNARLKALKTRVASYCRLSKPIYDRGNYVGNECDSALYTSLHGLACGYVDLKGFEKNGELYRSPSKKCPDGFDGVMALGFQLQQVKKLDKAFLDRVLAFYEKDGWYQDGFAQDVWYGFRDKAEGTLPEFPEGGGVLLTKNGFGAFADVTYALLKSDIYGKISKNDFAMLESQAERQPSNLYYQSMYLLFKGGNGDDIVTKLLTQFPKDRLPTNRDWCGRFLYWEDSESAAWKGCPKKKIAVHSGTDFLLTAWVLLKGGSGK